MTRLGQRLERDLNDIANHVTPSGSGWSQIRARIDDQSNDPDREVIMLELENRPAEQGRRRAIIGLVAGAAALVVAVAAGSLVRRGDDEPLATDTDPQASSTSTSMPPTPVTSRERSASSGPMRR